MIGSMSTSASTVASGHCQLVRDRTGIKRASINRQMSTRYVKNIFVKWPNNMYLYRKEFNNFTNNIKCISRLWVSLSQRPK